MTAQTASVRNIQLCLYRKVSCGFRLLVNVYWFFSSWSKKESTCILPRSSEVHHNKSVSCKIDLLLKFAVLFDNNRISVTKVWRGHVGSGTRCIKTYNLSTAEYKLYQSTVIKWSGYQLRVFRLSLLCSYYTILNTGANATPLPSRSSHRTQVTAAMSHQRCS